jgi:hypothetical protein
MLPFYFNTHSHYQATTYTYSPPPPNTPAHLVQLLSSDGLKEVAVVVDEPHTCVVCMQGVALLRLHALTQL